MIYCHRHGDSSPSDDEEDKEEAKNANEDVENDAPTDAPHAMPMETEPSHGAPSASSSSMYEVWMEWCMDLIDEQLTTMQSDIHGLTRDIAQMNLN